MWSGGRILHAFVSVLLYHGEEIMMYSTYYVSVLQLSVDDVVHEFFEQLLHQVCA